MQNRLSGLAGALLLAAGFAIGGWFVGQGFFQGRMADRFVTVKGISERIVKADLALWPVRFVATGNDLSEVQRTVNQYAETVGKFLADHGIPREQVEVQSLGVTDLQAQAYRSGPIESRFIVSQTLMVRSTDVNRIASASQRLSDLVDAGVVLNSEAAAGGTGPFYLFTELTSLKPAMIAEATKNARAAAAQFAADSGSRLGAIRRANQGLFQILPRDNTPGMMEQAQIHKTVRVVSTIEYLLVN